MSSHTILPGSRREHPLGSLPCGAPAPDAVLQIALILRRCSAAPDPESLSRFLSHEELDEFYGADPRDISAVEEFAHEQGFTVVSANPASRTITLSGPVGVLAAAFGADVELRQHAGKTILTRQGDLHIPAALHERVVAILGFDQRPAAATDRAFRPRAAHDVSYTPPQVASFYNFPAETGANQTIALIELGGGFDTPTLDTYWKQIGVPNVAVNAISVDSASTDPTGDPSGPDGEVVLDIEVAGGIAPGANIDVYFAQNTDQSFFNGIQAAIYNKTRKPSVLSTSWGSAESQWTPQALNAFNAAFHDAALLGISVCAASGDNGSSDAISDGRNHVDFPASSPWVLGCGGTSLIATHGKIQSETVWNNNATEGATGGGVSSHFSKPAYQAHIAVPAPVGTVNKDGRGVPDVAGVADPDTGFVVLVDGQDGVVGGTSAVAPLWAGLIARLNQALGKNLGWFHPALYGKLASAKALRDITSGNNGSFKAATGWDPCTGLGSPNGQAILNGLK